MSKRTDRMLFELGAICALETNSLEQAINRYDYMTNSPDCLPSNDLMIKEYNNG